MPFGPAIFDRDVLAFDKDVSTVGFFKANQASQDHGFAHARAAQEAKTFTFVKLEGDVFVNQLVAEFFLTAGVCEYTGPATKSRAIKAKERLFIFYNSV